MRAGRRATLGKVQLVPERVGRVRPTRLPRAPHCTGGGATRSRTSSTAAWGLSRPTDWAPRLAGEGATRSGTSWESQADPVAARSTLHWGGQLVPERVRRPPGVHCGLRTGRRASLGKVQLVPERVGRAQVDPVATALHTALEGVQLVPERVRQPPGVHRSQGTECRPSLGKVQLVPERVAPLRRSLQGTWHGSPVPAAGASPVSVFLGAEQLCISQSRRD